MLSYVQVTLLEIVHAGIFHVLIMHYVCVYLAFGICGAEPQTSRFVSLVH